MLSMVLRFTFFAYVLLLVTGCQAQPAEKAYMLLGGPCEGCEAVLEYGKRPLTAIDTLPGFSQAEYPLKLTGIIYTPDGRKPAAGVILYIYHTNEKGIYPSRNEDTGWARRHGYLRGWIKTGRDGRYTFYTQKPAAYPSRSTPAHVHLTLLEPNGSYYYLQDFYFAGDPLLTEQPENPRGGYSGVLQLKKEGQLWVGQQDIVLGSNIPDYP